MPIKDLTGAIKQLIEARKVLHFTADALLDPKLIIQLAVASASLRRESIRALGVLLSRRSKAPMLALSSRLLLLFAALALPASAAGKREGPWSTHHPNGKLALQANYQHGLPEGRWTSFYDNGHPAIVVSFRRGIPERAPNAFAGFLPHGAPWPAGAKLLPCNQGAPCTNPFEHLDLESLPPIVPDACPESAGKSRTLPRASWPPVLDAMMKAWPANPGGGEIPGPARAPCIKEIRLSCAPELDGLPGRDVLAEISYRFLLNSEKNCATKNLLDVWDMKAVVALSPPAADRKTWKPLGIVGYPQCMADVCPGYDTITGFVLLPSREVGIRVRTQLTGGDCRDEQWEEIRTLGERGPTTLAAKQLRCVKW